MLRLISALLLMPFCLPAFATNVSASTLVDRVVAMVDNNVVTASDVRLHAELAELDPSFVPILQGRSGTEEDDVINMAVLRSIAGNVPVYLPKPHQVRDRISQFRSRWSDNKEMMAFLAQHGLEGERLPAALRRRMIAERVVHRNFGPPQADMNDWQKRFDLWMKEQRSTIRVRIVARQEEP